MTEIKVLRLWVAGMPVAQPRHRVGAGFGRKCQLCHRPDAPPRAYIPDDHPVHDWKLAIQDAYRRTFAPMFDTYADSPFFDQALSVTFRFWMPRPASSIRKTLPNPPEHCPKQPDLDNLMKAAADALNGIAWADDRQIVEAIVSKRTGSPGVAGLDLVIQAADDSLLDSGFVAG